MLQCNNDSNSLEQLELARASRVRVFTRGLESSGKFLARRSLERVERDPLLEISSRVAIFPARRSTRSIRCQPCM